MLKTTGSDLPVPFPRSYWVIPGLLLAGEYPGAKDPHEAQNKLTSLFEAGIHTIINLMETDETDHTGKTFSSYDKLYTDIAGECGSSVSCYRYPIKDLNIPYTELKIKILDAIDEAIDQRKPVYVHCWGGPVPWSVVF